MQAVVKIGRSQYRVSPEQMLYVEILPEGVGKKFTTSQVLFYQEDDKIKIGKPYIKNAKVQADILEEVRGPKIRCFKYKRRKNYSRTWGHRQRYHKLKITSISV